jgi:hypothetical protein
MNLTFTEKSYAHFLGDQEGVHNSRLRPDHESLFDALLSKDADMTATSEGQRLLSLLENVGAA